MLTAITNGYPGGAVVSEQDDVDVDVDDSTDAQVRRASLRPTRRGGPAQLTLPRQRVVAPRMPVIASTSLRLLRRYGYEQYVQTICGVLPRADSSGAAASAEPRLSSPSPGRQFPPQPLVRVGQRLRTVLSTPISRSSVARLSLPPDAAAIPRSGNSLIIAAIIPELASPSGAIRLVTCPTSAPCTF